MEKTCDSCGNKNKKDVCFYTENVIVCPEWKPIEEEIQEKSCGTCHSDDKNNVYCDECRVNSFKYWFPQPSLLLNTSQKIDTLFDNFKAFLKEKNKRYGDSALKPQKIFSKQDSGSQICNRIDDKLGRIKNSDELKKNDISDLFGYVALLLIENDWLDFEDLID